MSIHIQILIPLSNVRIKKMEIKTVAVAVSKFNLKEVQ